MHLTLLLATLLLTQQPPGAAPSDIGSCLECHADASLTMTVADGATVPLHVTGDALSKSVHARLSCADCHTGMGDVPHPARAFRSARELTLAADEQCRRCHFDNYSRTLDSVHQASVARGDRMAPVCVDCHGSHDIRKASEPRTRVSESCATCHAGVAQAYRKSIHGRALGTAAERDVPVCTDCHRSHAISGPHQTQWDLRTPEMCGSCHANEGLMKKYGLSAKVLSTYFADFHGKTASLRQAHGQAASGAVVARCTDCHGVHEITASDHPSSPVMKGNLLKTCARCHADANENFPDAWLSHYEPSFKKAPVVYGVKLAYAALIPFMIGGLGLQILLHLWRVMVNR
jgi:nitrate/TMAO reductase-like tetraheme cytochrome c subunit